MKNLFYTNIERIMSQEQKRENIERFLQARKFAITKLLREYHYDGLMKEPESYFKDFIDSDKICAYVAKRTGQRWKYIMVTINFKEEVSFPLCMKKLIKCLKKKWILKYFGCWEWRDLDKGMHLHIRMEINEDKKVYDCKREIYNTFKHLVGNKLHVNMRYSNREDCFIEYIKGFKDGKEKDCIKDSITMCEKLGIERTFEGGHLMAMPSTE